MGTDHGLHIELLRVAHALRRLPRACSALPACPAAPPGWPASGDVRARRRRPVTAPLSTYIPTKTEFWPKQPNRGGRAPAPPRVSVGRSARLPAATASPGPAPMRATLAPPKPAVTAPIRHTAPPNTHPRGPDRRVSPPVERPACAHGAVTGRPGRARTPTDAGDSGARGRAGNSAVARNRTADCADFATKTADLARKSARTEQLELPPCSPLLPHPRRCIAGGVLLSATQLQCPAWRDASSNDGDEENRAALYS